MSAFQSADLPTCSTYINTSSSSFFLNRNNNLKYHKYNTINQIMSYSSEDSSSPTTRKFKGVRQRKWGKWVSEIRVPGTQERLWLGSFATAEAAAVARDVAYYCLRRPSTLEGLNFPMVLPCSIDQASDMSPRSIQKVASDAGMAIDARLINANISSSSSQPQDERGQTNGCQPLGMQTGCWEDAGESSTNGGGGEALSISIEDYL